jgi:uncharacterized RDD family membrane protein YckC
MLAGMSDWIYAALLRNRELQPAARARAGIWRRGFAALIDLILAMLLPTFIAIAIKAPPSYAPTLVAAGAAVMWPLINIISTRRSGATPGKRLLGMRVRTWDPHKKVQPPLHIGQILLREGIYKAAIPLSFVAWGQGWLSTVIWLGYLCSLRLRIDRRTIHDILTQTQVVRTRGRASAADAGETAASATKVPMAIEAGPAAPAEPATSATHRNQRSSRSRKRGGRKRRR